MSSDISNDDINKKWCNYCKDFIPLSEWSKSKNIGYCLSCWRKISSFQRSVLGRDKKDEYNIRRKIGGKNLYKFLFERQGGVCAICKQPERSNKNKTLSVDHNHTTERIRGLLCNNCNRALGFLRDDPTILVSATEYLQGKKSNKPLIYLACPYSHSDKTIMAARFHAANKKAAELMKQGLIVFSPISHCHPMAVDAGLPGNWEFWEKYDRTYLSCCHKIIVLMLDGWTTSTGVQAEIKIAAEMGITIEYAVEEIKL